jgi:photosystem II stability/assembly factor-like uncharacterized protein
MKKLILLIPSILLLGFANAQWQDVGSDISASTVTVYSLDVVNENVIWALGNSATPSQPSYSLSIDGGNTWNEGTFPNLTDDYYALSIRALDAQTAWILLTILPSQDSCRLFKTTDGGTNWTEQFGGFNEEGHALAIMHFFDANNGVL